MKAMIEPTYPSAQMIRWQGTSGAKGFRRNAPPTARGEEARAFDKQAYEETLPFGIWQRRA